MGGNVIIDIIEVLKAILIGIIQGITEWLPISSTGHMMLADEFIKLSVSAAFMEMFRVVIQLGSIFAVIVLYFSRLNPFSSSKTAEDKKTAWMLWLKVAFACIPAAIVGILFDDAIDAMFYNSGTVVNTLLIYGAMFLIMENYYKVRYSKSKPKIDSAEGIPFKMAAVVGLFQVLALIPGTSRSGATIIGALIIGMSRVAAAEFSFFLAIPTMLGASILKLVKFGFSFSALEVAILLIGTLTAFAVSIVSIRFLIDFVERKGFRLFGYYRILLGIVMFVYFALL